MSDPAVTPAPSPELRPRAAAPLTPPPQVAEGAEGASVSSPPELPVASECSSTADSSPTSPTSQSRSSSTTEAALKAVSEGELLSNVPLEDTLTGSAGPAPSPAPSPASSSCSLTPLSPLCRGGSLHLLRLPAGGGEHRPSHASTFSWSCCSTGSSVGAHSHLLQHFLPDSLPYVFQEFDPPSEGQAEGQELLLTNLEGSITLGEQVTATPTQAGRQTGRHRLTSDP